MFILPRRFIATKEVTSETGALNALVFDVPPSARLLAYTGLIKSPSGVGIDIRPNRLTTGSRRAARIVSFGTSRTNTGYTALKCFSASEELGFIHGLFWIEPGQERNYIQVAAVINDGLTQIVQNTFAGTWFDTSTVIDQIEFRTDNDVHNLSPGTRITLYEVPLF